MKHRAHGVIFLCSMLLLAVHMNVVAEVTTAGETNGTGIYVAGNPDFYPIEYYDSKTGQFAGVMPKILETISGRTGLDFTYIQSGEFSQTELANNRQVELVSAFVTDSSEGFAADTVTVFAYDENGKTVNVGLAFTEIADAALIEAVKAEAEKITENEINGYFMETEAPDRQHGNMAVVIAVLCCIVLALLMLLIWYRFKETVRQMDARRMTDEETGIGNLLYFEHHFEKTIGNEARPLYYAAYILIDGNFLQLYHGETVFLDAVKYAAGVLAAHTKHDGFAARITESGFALVFQRPNMDEARQHIEEIIGKLNMTAGAGDKNRRPVFHAAVYHLQKDDYNCELLLFNLRRNCNKIMGTDTQIMVCDVHAMNSAIEEKRLVESFSDGFKNKEFKLYLQFIVDNKTKKITSAEALSRWDSPDRGLLTPGKYIEAMESVGMISRLDFYMFETVCRQLHKWRETEFDSLTISCNFTRITLSEDDFAERIKEIASKYVFDRSKLVIEITEDAIEKNFENALDGVSECKKMGFRVALDDLGSGYTSLSNLCDYPVDIVKIDRDILLKTEKKSGRELFEGMVALAHSLQKQVICEGVETKEQHEFVSASSCDFIQGWYYSRVFPVKEGEQFYRTYCEANN